MKNSYIVVIRLCTLCSGGILIVMLLVGLMAFSSHARAQANSFRGKTIFVEKKCAGCHSAASAGIPKKRGATKNGPPDLSTVGARYDAAFLAKYLRKNETIAGKRHLLKFAGSDAELVELGAWLGSLKGGS